MNRSDRQFASEPTDADCAEAAAWIAKLHSSERDPHIDAGLQRWLDESSAHREALELANEFWAGAERFPKAEMPLHSLLPGQRQSPRRLPLALAASLVAIVASGYLYVIRAPSYTTGLGEQRTITLADGSRISMNTDTRLKVHYDESTRKIELVSGEALFDVAKDPKRPLTVIAGKQKIQALGTSFLVRYDSMQTSVTLMDGRVAVSGGSPLSEPSPASNTRRLLPIVTVLEPGERVTFVRNIPLAKIDTPELNRVTAWQRGQIILDHTTLADAIAEMNRYSETQIILTPDSQLQAPILVTGIFRAGDSEYFAQALAETHNLTVSKTGSRIILGR